MRQYELMYVVDPSVEETADDVKKRIEGVITGREGQVVSFERLGKKRLAFPIAKQQYGLYSLVNFRGDSRIIQALDYFLRLNPSVIRHLILSFSDKQLKLKNQTELVQREEAERMRLGGRPMGATPEEVGPVVVEGGVVEVAGEIIPAVEPEPPILAAPVAPADDPAIP